MGRSNIKTVADKRLPEVKKFLRSLLQSAPEILNSDIVITFFHPLLRDQQEADIQAKKLRENPQVSEPNIAGEIKFSIHYHRGTFIVMVRMIIKIISKFFHNFPQNSDSSRSIITDDDGRAGTQHLRQNLSHSRSLQNHQAENKSD